MHRIKQYVSPWLLLVIRDLELPEGHAMPHPKGSAVRRVGMEVRFGLGLRFGRPHGQPVCVKKLEPAARCKDDLQLHRVLGFELQSTDGHREPGKHSSSQQKKKKRTFSVWAGAL